MPAETANSAEVFVRIIAFNYLCVFKKAKVKEKMSEDSEVVEGTAEEAFERSTKKRHHSDDEEERSNEGNESNKRRRQESPSKDEEEVTLPRSPSAADEKNRATDLLKKPEVLSRNKRLFGSLMGHLGQAKQNLEKESDKIAMQKQVQLTVSEKRVRADQKRKSTGDRAKQRQQLEQNLALETKEFEKWKTQINRVKNFLATRSKPNLMWLPKQHNPTTTDLLQHRVNEVSGSL